ncbi:MAG: endonuclease/exonuclease/phosphatase family protein [Polyangiaceae bacterium]
MKKTLGCFLITGISVLTFSCGSSGGGGDTGGSGGTGGSQANGGSGGSTGGASGAGAGGSSAGTSSVGGANSGGAATGGAATGGTGTGGTETGGTSTGGTSTGGASTGGAASGGAGGGPVTLRVMSLNVYGYMTMPQAAPTYAALIEAQNVDVVGIQEGVQDWQLSTMFPTDYSRAEALGAALGGCYQREYQVFVNTCRGNTLDKHERFDLTDGPNATRTGEAATVTKGGKTFGFIDVHWDHQSDATKAANAVETAAATNAFGNIPVIVLGDFNAGCSSSYPSNMSSSASLDLIVNGGIDCIFSKSAPGSGMEVNASPSDHDAVVAELTL